MHIYGKTGMLLVGPKWSDFVFGNVLIIAYFCIYNLLSECATLLMCYMEVYFLRIRNYSAKILIDYQ